MTTTGFDGNFLLHRAMHSVARHSRVENLQRNTLTKALSFICNDAVLFKSTHVLVCFDSPQNFRKETYKKYKSNRIKDDTAGVTVTQPDGSEVKTNITPGKLVASAIEMLKRAGIATLQVKGYEADDLLGCLTTYLDGNIVIISRDKDSAALIRAKSKERGSVKVYWPIEKRLLDEKAVIRYWGVKPSQMRDYLTLMGDKIDCVPQGLPKCGPKTAVKILNTYGSIGKALKTKDGLALLKPHRDRMTLARQLISLKTDVPIRLEDLVPGDVDPSLEEIVWKKPKTLLQLSDSRKYQSMKGLFR